ncbi:MAG: hypothetical protein B7Z55_01000 [Planctomycetales bacterium 12-60-4]|nr:MAG: hypothetical protein B7Z55_01000 [Planctomycetales bacterium 12-60-4]
MLTYLRDKWRSAQLHARYQRIVQERVLELIEARGPEQIKKFFLLDTQLTAEDEELTPTMKLKRKLVQTNPYARNLLRLLEVYVAGPGMRVTAAGDDPDLIGRCDQLWQQFLSANRRHFTFVETARRTWRDGECFVRLFAQSQWPPAVRYIDPEPSDRPPIDPIPKG